MAGHASEATRTKKKQINNRKVSLAGKNKISFMSLQLYLADLEHPLLAGKNSHVTEKITGATM